MAHTEILVSKNNMDMINVLSVETIDLSSPRFDNKDEMYRHMAKMLKASGRIQDIDEFVIALYEREETGSTYMGNGIAVPHGKSKTVKSPSAAICRCTPFEYISADDHEDVNLAVMLAVPEEAKAEQYIHMLSSLSRLLLNERFLEVLTYSNSKNEVMKVYAEEMTKLPKLSKNKIERSD